MEFEILTATRGVVANCSDEVDTDSCELSHLVQ
jgi:hypothetical protein